MRRRHVGTMQHEVEKHKRKIISESFDLTLVLIKLSGILPSSSKEIEKMLPTEALKYLMDMGVIRAHGIGFFRIDRAPKYKRDFDLFVTCVKCLGAYSVSLDGKRAPVEVSCGGDANETIFKITA